ncbi:hypothetical protein IV51_GL000244 [Fructilactobacillus fructivorans]|nr:hypothetical protein FC73_GL000064 [Fructilactobacillus fructivorans]KRN40064.1 hypothetical protein IV51_GL000244 [Fructilactobacillus fructivorans]
MTVPKNDGSNQRKQVFPQTHPDAVIGLPEWQLNVQNALESIMGTNLGENRLSTVVHKSDLKNLVDKKQIDRSLNNAKDYTVSNISNLGSLQFLPSIKNMDDLVNRDDPYLAFTSKNVANAPTVEATKVNCLVAGNKDIQFCYYSDTANYRTIKNGTASNWYKV